MRLKLPTLAVVLGFAGLLPFLACGLFAVSTMEPTGTNWVRALVFYGAVILSFLGGVHWGLALAVPQDAITGMDGTEHHRFRFGLGVVPSLIGWAALASTILFQSGEVALAILIAGFIATVLVESRFRRGELMPSGYLWLRWALSVVVVAILVTVLVLRMIGAHIVPT
jgi:hypothetical protein